MRAVFLFLFVLVAPMALMAQSNTTGIMHRAAGTPGPTPTPTLPPQGIYFGCGPVYGLSTCETADSQMASDGFQWEIDYIGLYAHETGANSLASWFAYDASIGLSQMINIKFMFDDPNNPTNPLTATLNTAHMGDSTLATDCGATTNQQLIQCVINVAATVPGFKYQWYLADEPYCPPGTANCNYSPLPSNGYANIGTVAAWLQTNDPIHPVITANTGGGSQANITALGSWLMGSSAPSLMWDWYNWPAYMFNEPITYQSTLMGYLGNTITSTYPSENLGYVGIASAGSQSDISNGGGYCGNNYTLCPFPSAAMMQESRDQALYYAKSAGHPLQYLFWYAWEDTTCVNAYPVAAAGYPTTPTCNATNNRNALKAAAFAPYPVNKPAYGPAINQQCKATATNSCTFNNQVNTGDMSVAVAGDAANAPTCNTGWTTIHAYTASFVTTVGCYQTVSSGAITVTPFVGTATSRNIQVWEITGSGLALDTFSGGESTTAGTSTTTIVPTGTNDLILGEAWQGGTGTTTITVPTGYLVDSYCQTSCTTPAAYAAANNMNAASGSQSVTWTFNGSSQVITAYNIAIKGTLNP